MIKKVLLVVFGLLFLNAITPRTAIAQEEEKSFKARVTHIIEEKEVDIEGNKQWYQKIELTGTEGKMKGKKIVVENGEVPLTNSVRFKNKDLVIVASQTTPDNKVVYNIVDVVRTDSLVLLAGIFIILTAAVAKIRGITSLISMVLSFFVIFYVMLPQISEGQDPVLVTIVGSLLIVPITFYLSHGINKKTNIAIMSTFLSLIITGILAKIFVDLARLNGLASEESGFLLLTKQGNFNMQGLLLSGIMVGTLGILDDITVAQVGIVEQLKEASDKLKFLELFSRAMKVGQDHIASMINTLILVYAGASMPLLLIFLDNPHPFSEIVNYEFIAEEIVRTLVGSIGLILAVPIATIWAAASFGNKKK